MTGSRTSHHRSVYHTRWTPLRFGVCFSRITACTLLPRPLDVRPDETRAHDWLQMPGRGLQPKKHGEREAELNVLQKLGLPNGKDDTIRCEEEPCNIDDKKPLLKFEHPAASARSHFVLVPTRIFNITALIHAVSFLVPVAPFPSPGPL